MDEAKGFSSHRTPGRRRSRQKRRRSNCCFSQTDESQRRRWRRLESRRRWRAATASSAALADLGPGSDADRTVAARPVGQATGRAGKEFPDEFKPGLDAYFKLLEEQAGGK